MLPSGGPSAIGLWPSMTTLPASVSASDVTTGSAAVPLTASTSGGAEAATDSKVPALPPALAANAASLAVSRLPICTL